MSRRSRRPALETLEDRTLLDSGLSLSWVPNDPLFGQQWTLNNRARSGADVNAPAAWGLAIGSRRVTVAVMDTGIDHAHPDLYQNIWVNQKEIPAAVRTRLIDTDGDGLISFRDLNDRRNHGAGKITDLNRNGFIDGGDILRPVAQGGWADGRSQDGDRYVDDLIGWDFYNNDNNPLDDHGHGTHVAGTIGATGNNGVGVSGVAWQTQLLAVKIFGSRGTGSLSGIIAGLNYAVAKGAKVSNNSWAGSGPSAALQAAIAQARAAGHIFVAAAGNGGRDTDRTPEYPAGFALDNIVAVAATDNADNLASFSNRGAASVDLAAPGVGVLSTNPGKSYGNRSGTSMAAPHVTGVIALVWSLRPTWSYRQVIDHVMATADRVPSLAGKVAAGRVDAGNAVRALYGLVLPQSAGLGVAAASGAPVGAPSAPGISEEVDRLTLPPWALAEPVRLLLPQLPPPLRQDTAPLPAMPVPQAPAGPRFATPSAGRSSAAPDDLFADPAELELLRSGRRAVEALPDAAAEEDDQPEVGEEHPTGSSFPQAGADH